MDAAGQKLSAAEKKTIEFGLVRYFITACAVGRTGTAACEPIGLEANFLYLIQQ